MVNIELTKQLLGLQLQGWLLLLLLLLLLQVLCRLAWLSRGPCQEGEGCLLTVELGGVASPQKAELLPGKRSRDKIGHKKFLQGLER
jgi:hypothetical protein